MDFSFFDDSYYIYRANNGSLSDLELLNFVTTSVITFRVGDTLYFGAPQFMESNEFILIRQPLVV
jgi:hypothetical protein